MLGKIWDVPRCVFFCSQLSRVIVGENIHQSKHAFQVGVLAFRESETKIVKLETHTLDQKALKLWYFEAEKRFFSSIQSTLVSFDQNQYSFSTKTDNVITSSFFVDLKQFLSNTSQPSRVDCLHHFQVISHPHKQEVSTFHTIPVQVVKS